MRLVERLVRRKGKRSGLAPGTIVHTGTQKVHEIEYHLFEYSNGAVEERRPTSVPECFPFAEPPSVSWLNIEGLHDVSVLRGIGDRVGLHPLLLEDVVSIGQRPKVEEYESQLYIVLRMLWYNEDRHEVDEEQVSIVLGKDWVLSFQEQPGDVLEPVRERLRTGKGAVRSRGADFLAYALIDTIVDEYYTVLEKIGDRLEALENEVMLDPRPATINAVHRLKRELIVMRKAVWPVRDLLNSLVRDESELVTPDTRIFLRDAYDHAVQVIDTMETMRDLVSGIIDLYLSSASNRMNEIMKVLTIIATIFIPLTFLVGVYGMNFDHMPELHERWAYPVIWIVMILLGGGMLVWFRRRSWL